MKGSVRRENIKKSTFYSKILLLKVNVWRLYSHNILKQCFIHIQWCKSASLQIMGDPDFPSPDHRHPTSWGVLTTLRVMPLSSGPEEPGRGHCPRQVAAVSPCVSPLMADTGYTASARQGRALLCCWEESDTLDHRFIYMKYPESVNPHNQRAA